MIMAVNLREKNDRNPFTEFRGMRSLVLKKRKRKLILISIVNYRGFQYYKDAYIIYIDILDDRVVSNNTTVLDEVCNMVGNY